MGEGAPLRVLLWYWGRRGGGARYTLELARALARLPSVETRLSLSRQSELYAETKALGLPGLDVDTFDGARSAAWRTLALPAVSRRFVGYVARERIDAVICTMGHVWNGWVAPRLPPACRYLYTAHDAAPHPGDRHPGWHWLVRRNLSRADGLLTLSEHVRERILADFGFPAGRAWVAPLGPLAFPGHVRRAGARPRARRLLFFGRILPYKGLSLLLDAFERIAPARDLALTVAGAGDAGEAAGRMAANPRVRWDNRWIPEADVAGVFAAADLVVVPYVEASQSGVVASAYGMGLPVVATPVGGLREQVEPGRTGLVAADCTPAALAEALARLCDDADLYARCCAGAREAGQRDAAWDEIAERVGAACRAVCALPPRGA